MFEHINIRPIHPSSPSLSPSLFKTRTARIFELAVIIALVAASTNTPGRAQTQIPAAPSAQGAMHTQQPQAPNVPNAISGLAFRDKNSDGKHDATEPGVTGIVITAYGTDGTTRGTATTASDGSYSLSAPGAGPYRVEFTNFPLFMRPGPQGADSGTTVQFVSSPPRSRGCQARRERNQNLWRHHHSRYRS